MADQSLPTEQNPPETTTSSGRRSRDRKTYRRRFLKYEKFGHLAILISVLTLIIFATATYFSFVQDKLVTRELLDDKYYLVYLLLSVVGAFVILDRYLMHGRDVHRARLEDPSYVHSVIQQAAEYTHAADGTEEPSKLDYLKNEINRVKKISEEEWTEYQILPLERQLANFCCDSDLISMSTEKLSELNEYAQDSHYRYDIEEYYLRETKVNGLVDQVLAQHEKGSGSKDNKDEDLQSSENWPSQRLASEYKSLLGHISSYKHDWNEGSTIIKNLIICTVSSIILFLVMGTVPFVYPSSLQTLGLLHWGLLGSAGALTAVARDFRKTDLMAVGNTFGKKELLRAITGAGLGFMAGFVLWFLIYGEVLEQGIFPQINATETGLKDAALSAFWAIVAGLTFDRVFDHVKGQGDAAFR